MPRASWEFIGNLWITIPPRDEQQQIAAFLDRETARIDALIEKKQSVGCGEERTARNRVAMFRSMACCSTAAVRFARLTAPYGEHRSAPITAGVIGQIDVRDARPPGIG
jgi:hypothetical protein